MQQAAAAGTVRQTSARLQQQLHRSLQLGAAARGDNWQRRVQQMSPAAAVAAAERTPRRDAAATGDSAGCPLSCLQAVTDDVQWCRSCLAVLHNAGSAKPPSSARVLVPQGGQLLRRSTFSAAVGGVLVEPHHWRLCGCDRTRRRGHCSQCSLRQPVRPSTKLSKNTLRTLTNRVLQGTVWRMCPHAYVPRC